MATAGVSAYNLCPFSGTIYGYVSTICKVSAYFYDCCGVLYRVTFRILASIYVHKTHRCTASSYSTFSPFNTFFSFDCVIESNCVGDNSLLVYTVTFPIPIRNIMEMYLEHTDFYLTTTIINFFFFI